MWFLLLIFVSTGGVLFYTFIGYHFLMRVRARRCVHPMSSAAAPLNQPTIAVVIAAYQAEGLIGDRIRNLQSCDYPSHLCEIIVVSDGCTDGTAHEARAAGATVLEEPARRGKPACLNHGINRAQSEIIVLTDVRQRFAEDALRTLVAPFADARVGAVSGELIIQGSEGDVAQGIGRYWEMERQLRRDEALTGSAVGCTGAIYAIRRTDYLPLPEDTLIDDVVVPMRIARTGKRVLFLTEAQAFDPQALDPEREHVRKRRTLAGNFQMLFRYPQWCLPSGHPLWFRLLSHKYLRLAAPFFLMLCLLSHSLLAFHGHYFFALTWIPHLALYILGTIGLISQRAQKPFWLTIPAAFLFLNGMSLAGLVYYLRSRKAVGW